jgi:hypothetical protein
MKTETSTAELLAAEIRNHHGGLLAALNTRKYHPTFGVTKASLRERLARLEGLLYAHGIVLERKRSANFPAQAVESAVDYGFILVDLARRVQDA